MYRFFFLHSIIIDYLIMKHLIMELEGIKRGSLIIFTYATVIHE